MEEKMYESTERVSRFLKKAPALIAGTMGFDKKPQLHKTDLCYEEDGAFYFAAEKCGRFYGELSLYPQLVLCAYDADEKTLLRIRGLAVFTEEKSVIERCLEGSDALYKRWCKEPDMLIAFFLKDMTAEWIHDDGTREEEDLGTPENVLVGITVRKGKELRDRLVRIMEEREKAATDAVDKTDVRAQKVYDGTLLYLLDKAKEVWPRMNVQPAERSVLFETYDEREEYVRLARKRLGNARIEKPEDITYWLSSS